MKYLLFIIMLCTSILCCKKDEIPYPLSELPPATQTGAHTMGCLVNGRPWVAGYDSITFLSGGFMTSTYDLDNNFSDDNFLWTVTANHYFANNDIDRIDFSFLPLTKTGVISPGDNIRVRGTPFFNHSFYVIDTLMPYKFNITNIGYADVGDDWRKRITSGTFEFYCVSEKMPKDTLHITEGRFDLTYLLQ